MGTVSFWGWLIVILIVLSIIGNCIPRKYKPNKEDIELLEELFEDMKKEDEKYTKDE